LLVVLLLFSMFLTTLGFACGIIQLVAFSVIYMFMLGLF
jgi:hypothetical protein